MELMGIRMSNWLIALCISVLIIFIALAGFMATCVNFVDNYEVGYRFDTFGEKAGKIEVLPRTGYFVTWPYKTKIHTIDGRPMQVCISSINRVLNCKLVQFNPKGIDLFLSWHGRSDYDNSGTTQYPSLLNQILMAYAYEGSGKEYPFLTVIRELKPSEIQDIQK